MSVITVDADVADTVAALKASQKQMNRDFKEALQDAADMVALPAARSVAPHVIRQTLVAKATTRRVYVTTLARDDRRRAVFALTEFGGVIKAGVVPKNGRALRFADGRFFARVKGPRRYKGKHRMGRAIEARFPAFERRVVHGLEQAIDRRLERGL